MMAVVKVVAYSYGITPEEIISRTRKGTIAEARYTCWRILIRDMHRTMEAVGREFSLRDHATVSITLRNFEGNCDTDSGYRTRWLKAMNRYNDWRGSMTQNISVNWDDNSLKIEHPLFGVMTGTYIPDDKKDVETVKELLLKGLLKWS